MFFYDFSRFQVDILFDLKQNIPEFSTFFI